MDQLGRGFEPQVSLYLLVFLLFVLQTTGKGLSVYWRVMRLRILIQTNPKVSGEKLDLKCEKLMNLINLFRCDQKHWFHRFPQQKRPIFMWNHEHLWSLNDIPTKAEKQSTALHGHANLETDGQKASQGMSLKIHSACFLFFFVFFTSARVISFCVPAYIKLQHPSPLALLVWHRGTPAVAPHLLWR